MQPLNKYQGFYIFLAFQDENDLPIKQTLSCSSPTRWFDFYCASIHKQHPAWGTPLPIGRISVITLPLNTLSLAEKQRLQFFILYLWNYSVGVEPTTSCTWGDHAILSPPIRFNYLKHIFLRQPVSCLDIEFNVPGNQHKKISNIKEGC